MERFVCKRCSELANATALIAAGKTPETVTIIRTKDGVLQGCKHYPVNESAIIGLAKSGGVNGKKIEDIGIIPLKVTKDGLLYLFSGDMPILYGVFIGMVRNVNPAEFDKKIKDFIKKDKIDEHETVSESHGRGGHKKI